MYNRDSSISDASLFAWNLRHLQCTTLISSSQLVLTLFRMRSLQPLYALRSTSSDARFIIVLQSRKHHDTIRASPSGISTCITDDNPTPRGNRHSYPMVYQSYSCHKLSLESINLASLHPLLSSPIAGQTRD